MKNKKGFTLVELMTTVSLISIIAILLIRLTITLKTIYIDGDMKTTLLTKQGTMTDKIYKDLKEKDLSSLTSCGENCVNFNYIDGTKKLKINESKKLITYGNYSIKLNDSSYFGTSYIDKYDGDVGDVLSIKIPIYNRMTKGDYGIYITYQKDNIEFDNSIVFSVSENIYEEKILNGAYPVYSDNLIPVTIENNGKVRKADISSKWYSYEDKKWANAVVLKENTSYNKGDEIPESNIESYFVWIPKYSYKLFDLGNYNNVINEKPTKSNNKTISIKFGIENTKDSNNGECTTSLTAGATGNCKVGDYMTHPAFIAMNSNGLWVGKYETGYNGANSKAEAQQNSDDSSKIIIKPNVFSWRNINVKNAFTASYNYLRDNDSHMMKNTEWGAVAYLSFSKYGINKEVNINNDSDYKTGYSASDETDQSNYPGEYGTDDSKTLAYNTETGYKASTTGNITGIYDMSGGAHEYMASYISGTYGSSGFASTDTYMGSAYSKYFDTYPSASSITTYNKRILGDATGEAGPFYNYADNDNISRYHNNWYADASYFVMSSFPWFYRGGDCNYGVLAGQFYFGRYTGEARGFIDFRIVLTK